MKKWYYLVAVENLSDLDLEVNKMIDKGFEPFGNIFYDAADEKLYYQPMLKECKEGISAEESWANYGHELMNEDEAMTEIKAEIKKLPPIFQKRAPGKNPKK
jgi:hypothetical protein